MSTTTALNLPPASVPNQAITWQMPLTEKAFPLYTLAVGEVAVPVWSARVREEIHKPEGAGWTHMLNGRTDWCGFARFDFAGAADVVVTVARDFQKAEIVPRSAGITPTVAGRTIRFRMEAPRPLTLLLDGQDGEPLHLFTHRPETDVPKPDDPNVIYFGPGEHWVDSIKVRSGQTVYLDGAAVVRAVLPAGIKGKQGGVLNLFSYPGPVLDVSDAHDVRICGRGILDGTLLPHPARNLIRLNRSQRVRVEGVTLRNSPNWHLPIVDCDDVTVDGLCGISGRLNSDGINCVSSRGIRVRDCFIRGHDDTFAVKTTLPDRPARDIRYERCVAWNDWGYALGVTYETRAAISDVTFSDCDVIFARNWPIGVHATDGGSVEDIRFERVTVDFPRTSIAPEMSRRLVKIDNHKDVWATDAGIAHVRRISLQDIDVRGVNVPSIEISGQDAAHPIEGVSFAGVVINGQPLDSADPALLHTNAHVRGVSWRKDAQPSRPLVGAIRWDAWTGGEVTRQVEQTLGPKRYHARLPWFAEVIGEDAVRIDGGRQEIMDREIGFAAEAGLDYWAFLLYPEPNCMSESLRYYLGSAARGQVKFCLILHNAFGVEDAQWPHERDRAVALLREPGYQTVLGGRPLVYAFQVRHQGVFPAARFAEFRRAAQAAGVDPYCVFMGWDPAADFKAVAPLGFDAVSHYACGSADATFAQLCQRVERGFWQNAAAAGVPYVPLVTAGWDKTPRKEHPVSWEKDHDYHRQAVFPATATPTEIAGHLDRALTFVREHAAICPANAVIIYSWNEHDEGGWLVPTWTPQGMPDCSRLEAIGRLLNARPGSAVSGAPSVVVTNKICDQLPKFAPADSVDSLPLADTVSASISESGSRSLPP